MSVAGPDVQHLLRAILVTGPPGSGKSTVGALLAQRLGAALIDLDTATAALTAVIADLLSTDDLDDPQLVAATRTGRYEAITALAEENLRLGVSVVLVAPFTTERRDPAAWAALASRLAAAGGTPSLIWLRLDAASAAGRLAQRGAARDAAKVVRPRDANGHNGIDLEPPVGPHIRADAALPPERLAETILENLPGSSGRG